MTRAGVVGLIVAIGAAQLVGSNARAQGDAWGGGAPRVFVEGQPWQAPPTPDGVRVDIAADSPNVRLVRVDGGQDTVICAAPCGVVVPRNGEYQIAGDGVVRTSRFSVPADRPDLQLNVKSGSNGQRWGGIILGVAGYVTAAAGESLWSVERTATNVAPNPRAQQVGIGMMISGVVAGTLGLVMIFTANTHVTTSSGVSFTYAPPSRRRMAIRLTPAGLEF
jgi:hypothetical protein